MQDQNHEKKASESGYGKRHHPIENPPSPQNPDPPPDPVVRPPYGGPGGGRERKDKK